MCTYCLYSDASDAVETHSCVKLDSELLLKSRDASVDDKTQKQDTLTLKSLSTAYNMTKTFESKRPAIEYSSAVVFLFIKNFTIL